MCRFLCCVWIWHHFFYRMFHSFRKIIKIRLSGKSNFLSYLPSLHYVNQLSFSDVKNKVWHVSKLTLIPKSGNSGCLVAQKEILKKKKSFSFLLLNTIWKHSSPWHKKKKVLLWTIIQWRHIVNISDECLFHMPSQRQSFWCVCIHTQTIERY